MKARRRRAARIAASIRAGRTSSPRNGYSITPRPASVGGGWQLRVFEHGVEIGGGAFPCGADDPDGVNAWNDAYELAQVLCSV